MVAKEKKEFSDSRIVGEEMDIRTKISILFGIVVGGVYLIVSMNRMNDKIQLPEYVFTEDMEKADKLLSELETKKEKIDKVLDDYDRLSAELKSLTYRKISYEKRINSLSQVGAISALLITILLLIYYWKRSNDRNQKVQTFLTILKRYNELIYSLPKEEMYDKDFNLAAQTEEKKAKILEYACAYFDLVFEAYYLNKEKLIDRNSWTTFKSRIKMAISKPAFNQSWYAISEEQMYDYEFKKFVKHLISS